MPNFKGTLQEKSNALWWCLILDASYILPYFI